MNPVVHFEMPAEDRERVADFYATVFDWKMKQYGPEMGNYLVAQTAKTDEAGMIKKPGSINGGFFTKTSKRGYPNVVIKVDNIHAAMKKVEAAGGKVLGGLTPGIPEDMPGLGKFINIKDTEGNVVSLMEPAKI
jgi:predicted enzyme related to lactoylglutathione lyase